MSKKYYEKNREQILANRRIKRETMSPEELDKVREREREASKKYWSKCPEDYKNKKREYSKKYYHEKVKKVKCCHNCGSNI